MGSKILIQVNNCWIVMKRVKFIVLFVMVLLLAGCASSYVDKDGIKRNAREFRKPAVDNWNRM